MKKTKFQRITAFALALVFLFCGTIMSVSASSEGNASVSDKTTSDIKELLNAISYGTYVENNNAVPKATEADEIVFDAVADFDEEGSDEGWKKETYDGKEGLFLPSVGVFSWTKQIPQTTKKYNVVVEYYPVDAQTATCVD